MAICSTGPACVQACAAEARTPAETASLDNVLGAVCLLLLSGLFSGLTLGLMSLDIRELEIAIAGADKKWHWAKAEIDGETVVVTSPEVPAPVAVRYGFEMNPVGANLYNKEGLPASPFRTDDW